MRHLSDEVTAYRPAERLCESRACRPCLLVAAASLASCAPTFAIGYPATH